MKAYLNQIRKIVDEMEASADAQPQDADRDFSALELPAIIQEIVDDLQPLLSPYEAAFYWYALRHSIAKDGSPHLRLSTRALQHGLVKSSYSTATENRISLEKCARFSVRWKL